MSALIDYLSQAQLLYGSVWEDDDVLTRGLAITADDDVLSIASAGDNVLALLSAGARSVLAVDLNPAQLALVELKLAGVEALTLDSFCELIGERHTSRAWDLYQSLRAALTPGARRYWDGHRDLLESGIAYSGRLERYFEEFRHRHLVSVCDEASLRELFEAPDLAAQRAWLVRDGRVEKLRQLVGFFGRETMAQRGRSASQLAHVDCANQEHLFFERLCHLLTTQRVKHNPYLRRFFLGGLRDLRHGPTYLTPSGYSRLGARTSRVALRQAEISEVIRAEPQGRFSKANLSDLFEYLSATESEALFALLADKLSHHGRFAFWCLLTERQPRAVSGLRYLASESEDLSSKDRIFFYDSFQVHEVGR